MAAQDADEAMAASASAGEGGAPPGSGPGTARGKRRELPDWGRLLIKLGLISGLLTLVFTLVLGVQIQRGNRMHPYVADGDLLVYSRLEDPQVDDLVVYRHPNTGQPALSRVVAVGENLVQLSPAGTLSVNGLTRAERVFYSTEPLEGSTVPNPCPMEEGEYFLLDDYRTVGLDSRSFGPVQREDILGKVVYLFRRRGF